MAAAIAWFLIVGVAVLLIPPQFTTHEAAIGYVLRQHGVAYKHVILEQTRLDTLNFYSYGRYSAPYSADVTVQLLDGREAHGRIQCKVERKSCYLLLSEFGPTKLLLPELASDQRLLWLNWLWEHLPRFPDYQVYDGQRS